MNSEYYSSILEMLQRTRQLSRSGAGAGNTAVHEAQLFLPRRETVETDSQEIAAAALLAYQQQQLLGTSGLTGSSTNFSSTGEYLPIHNFSRNQVGQGQPDGSSSMADQRFLGTPFAPTGLDMTSRFYSSTLKEGKNPTTKAKSQVVGSQSEPPSHDSGMAPGQAPKERGGQQKRPRHEDLLNRTRETMMRKTIKKVKHPPEIGKDVRREDSHPQLSGVKKYVPNITSEFPLPPTADQKRRTMKASLVSYRALWQKLGGYKNKELFQKMVQNGAIPVFRPTKTQFQAMAIQD